MVMDVFNRHKEGHVCLAVRELGYNCQQRPEFLDAGILRSVGISGLGSDVR
jgi:hypothetical protein